MAPSWVLLDRDVSFSHDAAVYGGASEGGGELIGDAREGRRGPPNFEEEEEALLAYLQTLKPDAYVADPPKVSSLRVLRPTKSIPLLCEEVNSGTITSADKSLVALYADPYLPGTDLNGCYLIYDARKNSLSMIPKVPFAHFRASIGFSALVMCDGHGEGAGYVLAELVRVVSSSLDEFELYLWRSSATEWVTKVGRFPVEVVAMGDFMANLCFSFEGSILCWVDLLKGMVVCDLRRVQQHNSDVEFRFIPLTKECTTYTFDYRHGRGLLAEEFRSMACVGGTIKFITMDGYVEHRPNEVKLTMWTLSPDLSMWKKGKVYTVDDIWKNKTRQSLRMPKFPVLSMHEDDVVYLVFTDVREVNNPVDYKIVDYKSQYMLRVDMGHNKVQFYPLSTKRIKFQPLASEFSAYRHGLEDHLVLLLPPLNINIVPFA